MKKNTSFIFFFTLLILHIQQIQSRSQNSVESCKDECKSETDCGTLCQYLYEEAIINENNYVQGDFCKDFKDSVGGIQFLEDSSFNDGDSTKFGFCLIEISEYVYQANTDVYEQQTKDYLECAGGCYGFSNLIYPQILSLFIIVLISLF
ncbi:hypothetical protein PPERSA_08301 [Pseudocohnilembus persalinus]|uniref:Transmembrane protein n=1 Tax=Pseudocohnilembus persalinus TaxID=266149 RepID=A0A0V0QP82_PSEPJ|nr:hypothetical protein PPERSA_08301 [Pseudocohnilembus persalinus]|eukprot:KRX04086.1 hypothetical protein PPERSA_08301 [Pseudocohnilembus persalinus]